MNRSIYVDKKHYLNHIYKLIFISHFYSRNIGPDYMVHKGVLLPAYDLSCTFSAARRVFSKPMWSIVSFVDSA